MIKVRRKAINLFRLFGYDLQKRHRPFIRFLKDYYHGISGRRSIIGAEIGVLNGVNAENILKNLSVTKLYLIDPYKLYQEFSRHNDKDMNEVEVTAHKRLDRFAHRTVWIKKTSDEAVEDIKEKLDFIYIDGNHAYEFVKKDMENYYSLLKEGGILAGHDIAYKGVMTAFTEFAKDKISCVLPPDWIIIKK